MSCNCPGSYDAVTESIRGDIIEEIRGQCYIIV